MGFRTPGWSRFRWFCVEIALGTATGGCGTDAIVPPPTPGLNAISTPAESASEAPWVVLISGPKLTDEIREWEQAARNEAGRTRVIFSAIRPELNDPPAAEASLIRENADKNVSALIVDTVDEPEVIGALKEARDKGKTVVLLDPTGQDSESAKPLPRVLFGTIEPPAKVLIDAILASLKKDNLPVDGHALIVIKIGSGPRADQTAERLAKVLTSAGYSGVEVVSVVDNFQEAAKPLKARIEADPKVTTLLGVGDTQIRAAMTARDDLKKAGKRVIRVGGVVTLSRPIEMAGFNDCVGILDRNQTELARKAIQTALSLVRGESSTTEVQVPIVYHEGVASPRDVNEERALSRSVLKPK